MAVILVELVGVQDALVGAGLVEETLALGVDLQERLAAHPEEAALAVLGLVTARHCVGLQGGTVEHHHAVGVVELCAHPDAGLDAVTGSTGDRTVAAHDGQILRLQGFHHVIVQGVAAGADDNALGSVDADVLAVLVLSDDADHAVVLLHQLHHGGVVHELDAETRGIIGQDLCTVQGLAGAVVGTGPAGRVAGSKVDVAVAVVVAAGLVPQLHAAVSQTIAVPVDGLSGLLAEQAHQALVDVTGCDLGHLGDVIELVDLGAPFLLVTAVDGAQVVADAAAGHLVDDQGLCAVLGSAAGCKQAARAAADHQNFGLEGVHDVAVSDDGSGAQPLRGAVVHGLGGSSVVARPMACSMQLAAAFFTALLVMVAPEMLSISELWAAISASWKSAAESTASAMVSLEVSTFTSVMALSLKVMVTVTAPVPVSVAV